jgi:catechol 2,3-dioxygenase-like lactoylglutathione lyase family enzyme
MREAGPMPMSAMKILAALLVAACCLGGEAEAEGIKIAGIDHVGVNVPNLKQAEAFLVSTFGCRPMTHIGPFATATRGGHLSLAMVRCGEGANIELFEYTNATGNTLMPKSEDIGASHIAFYTDDVQAGIAYLKSQGIVILGAPTTVTGGETEGETWVHFLSPWGSEMELVSYPHGKGYEKTTPLRLWNPARPGD